MQDKYEIPFKESEIKEIIQQYSHEKLSQYLSNDVFDRALGCLFGSFIGDALGAFLEFKTDKIFKQEIKKVMTMPGGGVFNLKQGQVTDDSELAFHLLKALTKIDFGRQFQKQQNHLILTIAAQYLSWLKSRPFDIGITCRKGLDIIQKTFKSTGLGLDLTALNEAQAKIMVDILLANVVDVSSQSESNGSLMRITPLPFFASLFMTVKEKDTLQENASKMKQEVIKDFVKKQISILHPNKNLQEAGYIWYQMLISMIKRKSDDAITEINRAIYKMIQKKVPSWSNAVEGKEKITAKQKIGWSKIAFSLGMRALREIFQNKEALNAETYKNHIFRVLEEGGDTDTNAAIVGGMLGALVGFKNLPRQYITKLINLRHKQVEKKAKRSSDRTQFYEPRTAFANAFLLIQQTNKLYS